MRILALDYGLKRIGVAISDALLITAQPHPFISNDSDFISKIKELIEEYEIATIIIGNPKHMNNDESKMGVIIADLKEQLSKETGLPIKLWDERLSTVAVQKYLNASELKREKKKELVDSLAASFILQGYLDSL